MVLRLTQPLINFFIVSFAIPSLQLRLTTSFFSNLDSTLRTNIQYLSIVQCRDLVLVCSHILLSSCLAQILLTLCSAFNSDHYAHYTVPMAWSCWSNWYEYKKTFLGDRGRLALTADNHTGQWVGSLASDGQLAVHGCILLWLSPILMFILKNLNFTTVMA
jgi:hypothetical protein